MKVLLQFPEGLKEHALNHAKELEAQGHEVFISSAQCYGACDLCIEEAKFLNADKIIHFGHAKFLKGKTAIETEYILWREDLDFEILEKAFAELSKMNYKKIAIGTTIQHSHQIPEIKKAMEKHNIIPLTSKGFWAVEEAQVLGCDATAVNIKEAEAILYIGSGMFHPLAFLGIEKDVFVLNHKTGELKKINESINRLLKRRKGSILKALDAETFAVIVSTKPGQARLEVAKWAKSELEKRGKKAMIAIANSVDPVALENMRVQCYINTACPRIIDDNENYSRPFLNIDMFMELLNLIDEMKKQKPKFKADYFYWSKKKED